MLVGLQAGLIVGLLLLQGHFGPIRPSRHPPALACGCQFALRHWEAMALGLKRSRLAG